jgi:hypothetical protein
MKKGKLDEIDDDGGDDPSIEVSEGLFTRNIEIRLGDTNSVPGQDKIGRTTNIEALIFLSSDTKLVSSDNKNRVLCLCIDNWRRSRLEWFLVEVIFVYM